MAKKTTLTHDFKEYLKHGKDTDFVEDKLEKSAFKQKDLRDPKHNQSKFQTKGR